MNGKSLDQVINQLLLISYTYLQYKRNRACIYIYIYIYIFKNITQPMKIKSFF